MRSVQRVGNLNRQANQNFRLNWFSVNAMLQRHAVQKFHDHEGLPVLLVNLIDGADVGMVQGRCSFGLPLEAAQCLRVSGYFIRKEFEGDEAVQFDVLGLVHDTHSTAAELLNNAVMRDGLSDK